MRVALVGLACVGLAFVLASTVGVAVGVVVSEPLFHYKPGQGEGFAIGLDELFIVMPSLLIGLCLAAPFMPGVATRGLRSVGGVVLALFIVICQLGAAGLFIYWFTQWDLAKAIAAGPSFAATVVPGMTGTIIAFFFFDRFAVPARAAESWRLVRAGLISSAGGTVIICAAWPAYNFLYRPYYGPSAELIPLLTVLSVCAALLAGLAMVAPLAPRLAAGGLRTRRGVVLAVATAGFALLIGPYLWLTGYAGWPVLLMCTLVPSLAGFGFALWLFDRQLNSRRSGTSRPAAA